MAIPFVYNVRSVRQRWMSGIVAVLGIAGSFVGNFIAGMLGMTGPVGWIGSVAGAMLLPFAYRLIAKK